MAHDFDITSIHQQGAIVISKVFGQERRQRNSNRFGNRGKARRKDASNMGSCTSSNTVSKSVLPKSRGRPHTLTYIQVRRGHISDASIRHNSWSLCAWCSRVLSARSACCSLLLQPRPVICFQMDLTAVIHLHPRILRRELRHWDRLRPSRRQYPGSCAPQPCDDDGKPKKGTSERVRSRQSLDRQGKDLTARCNVRLWQRPCSVLGEWPKKSSNQLLRFRRPRSSMCPVSGSTGTRRPWSVQK